MDAQSTRVDVEGGQETFPVSIKLNDVSLLGYIKPDTEEQQDYFISTQQSPDNLKRYHFCGFVSLRLFWNLLTGEISLAPASMRP